MGPYLLGFLVPPAGFEPATLGLEVAPPGPDSAPLNKIGPSWLALARVIIAESGTKFGTKFSSRRPKSIGPKSTDQLCARDDLGSETRADQLLGSVPPSTR